MKCENCGKDLGVDGYGLGTFHVRGQVAEERCPVMMEQARRALANMRAEGFREDARRKSRMEVD